MDYLLESQIRGLVQGCVRRSDPERKIWRDSLTGFAQIDDRPFDRLRTWAGEGHLLPDDILPGAESVVSFFIPFTEEVTCSNNEGTMASKDWGETYVRTRDLIDEIGFEITSILEAGGFNCGVHQERYDSTVKDLVSPWSHRHIAWLCGLGSFGRNNLLITEAGCSGRLGSLVTDAPLSTTPMPEAEYCIEKQGGSCGVCIGRCAKGALTEEDYDRYSCREQCLDNAANLKGEDLMDVCGKCLTKLPCTFRVPVFSR
ncbi:MAG: hypothetical protein PQJ50_05640 [Spirochaetales bacterium]|nr:hypothetical protein [Spirochaetales bacterium]